MINSNGDVSTLSGNGIKGFKDGPSNTAMFNRPRGVCIDSNDNIIVADTLQSQNQNDQLKWRCFNNLWNW